jgi:predicted nucleic acid-binding protein
MTPGLTLDTGALISIDRGERRIAILIASTVAVGGRLTVPAAVVAQAIRRPDRQVGLLRLVRHKNTDIVSLDEREAVAVGRLLAQSRTSDVVDAHVVVCARRTGQSVVTSDPNDIHQLDASIDVVVV